MKALMDTHTFPWWILDDPLLSPTSRAFIVDGSNEVIFSTASGWEIAIKAQRSRLCSGTERIQPGGNHLRRLQINKEA